MAIYFLCLSYIYIYIELYTFSSKIYLEVWFLFVLIVTLYFSILRSCIRNTCKKRNVRHRKHFRILYICMHIIILWFFVRHCFIIIQIERDLLFRQVGYTICGKTSITIINVKCRLPTKQQLTIKAR